MDVISVADWIKILMMMAGGILTGGCGVLGWGITIERRLMSLEDDNPRDTRQYAKRVKRK